MLNAEIELFPLLTGLFGGLALFLFGMDLMTDALKSVAGSRMKTVLSKLTTNRFKGVLAGTFVTAIIQSSSVTTVLVVGFISAGLMSLQQSVGIILGANIGTTITAQVIAFKVTHYALILVSIGFLVHALSTQSVSRKYGSGLLGLGLIFYGMDLMSRATFPLRDYEPFIRLMENMASPLIGILVATIFTAVIQSSSATTGIIIVLASQGRLSLDAGIALIFGANIGTCITAWLASLGKPVEAVRAAVIHILFKVFGVLLWIAFIPQFAELVRWISPQAIPDPQNCPDISSTLEICKAALESPRQIANAHTIFNVANTLIFIWLSPLIVKLAEKLVPARKRSRIKKKKRSRFLDNILISTPAIALDRCRLEIARMGDHTVRLVEESCKPLLEGKADDVAKIEKRMDGIDRLREEIVNYLRKVARQHLSFEDSHILQSSLSITNNLETIGELYIREVRESSTLRMESGLQASPATSELLTALHGESLKSLKMAVASAKDRDPRKALEVQHLHLEVKSLSRKVEEHLVNRLAAREPNRLELYQVESRLVEVFRRTDIISRRMARIITKKAKI